MKEGKMKEGRKDYMKEGRARKEGRKEGERKKGRTI